MRINGSIIGTAITSSTSNARGFWDLRNIEIANRTNSWPNALDIVTSGLTLNLDAGNASSYPGSGTSWYDLSGNNRTGTLTNGPTYSSANMGSIVFDGVDDYISFSSLLDTTANVSVEMWFYNTQTSGESTLFSNGYGSTTGYIIGLGLCSSGITTLNVTFGGIACGVVTATVSTNAWYQMVFTKTGSSNVLYTNGTQRSTASRNCNSPAGGTIIGDTYAPKGGVGGFYKGNIAIARMYNTALSAAEVLQNYNAIKNRFGL
jgi:hypothetical protein